MTWIDRAAKILTMDFTFTQVAAEIPYTVIQPLIFTAIVYPMVGFVGYIMGLVRIIFNKSNKTLWAVTLSVLWFNTLRDFD